MCLDRTFIEFGFMAPAHGPAGPFFSSLLDAHEHEQETQVTLGELIGSTTWAEVKAALQWLLPNEQGSLPGFRKVFSDLQRVNPKRDAMRIAIECAPMPGDDEKPVPGVFGRDGTLNRDLDDFNHLRKHATAEYGAEETKWSLSLRPWESWLGMTLEPKTLAAYTPAQVIALCLNEMTFHGFSEAEIREVSEELTQRAAQVAAMSREERSRQLIPAEKVFARLRKKSRNSATARRR
jgi:hypothetical protein